LDSFAEHDSAMYYYDTQTNQVVKLPDDVFQALVNRAAKLNTPQQSVDDLMKSMEIKINALVAKKVAEITANN
jgi:hypothetical protein